MLYSTKIVGLKRKSHRNKGYELLLTLTQVFYILKQKKTHLTYVISCKCALSHTDLRSVWETPHIVCGKAALLIWAVWETRTIRVGKAALSTLTFVYKCSYRRSLSAHKVLIKCALYHIYHAHFRNISPKVFYQV